MERPVRHTEFFSAAHYAAAYTFTAPPAALQDSAEYIWQSRFDMLDTVSQPEVYEQLFAHLSCSLVFSEGQPFAVTDGGLTQSISSDAVLIGHHSRPVLFRHLRDNKLTGIKLKPGAFYRLSGIPAASVCNHIVPLRELAPALYRSLQRDKGFTTLPTGFHKQADAYRYDAVHQALCLYQSELYRNPDISALAARLYLTPRTLNRYFTEVLGMTPKKVCSIVRLRTALRDRTTGNTGSRFSFYDYGYTDHSHFYKDLATYAQLHSLQLP